MIKNKNSIYFRLFVFYIALVVFVTLLIGTTAYTYSSTNINNELITSNQKMLGYLGRFINENILMRTEKIYVNMVLEQQNNDVLLSIFNSDTNISSTKLQRAYQYLKNIVFENSDIVDSIHVYYKNIDTIVSSTGGIRFLNGSTQNIFFNVDWLWKMKDGQDKSMWIESRKVTLGKTVYMDSADQQQNDSTPYVLTYVKTYPFVAAANQCLGYIAVDIKEEAVRNLLTTINPSESGEVYIVSSNGNLISKSGQGMSASDVLNQPFMQAIIKSSDSSGNLTAKVSGVNKMASYTVLKENGWKLITVIPLNLFYKTTVDLQRTLLYICLVVILLGFIMASMLTKNIYSPLKLIIDNINALFGSSESQKKNEYVVISETINTMSVKVNQLEKTLMANRPLIKHNLVSSLLSNRIKSSAELDERLNLINVRFKGQYFNVVMLNSDAEVIDSLNIENIQYMKYEVMYQIENLSNEKTQFLAMDLSDYRMAVIVNTEPPDDNEIQKLVNYINTYIYTNFCVKSVAVVGTWVNNPLEVHKSFENANILLKYLFFFPNKTVLYADNLLQRELAKDEIPDEIIEEFTKYLNTGDTERVKNVISELTNQFQEGNYPADYCQQKLLAFVSIVSKYLKKFNIKTNDIMTQDLLDYFRQIKDIVRFNEWMFKIIDEIVLAVQMKQQNRNSEIVEKIKQFIAENLDQNLSLGMIADKVYLNPQYMSKLFYDETGMHLPEFILERRLSKASELLERNNLTIEQIAKQVGFNTTHYFIKKFKEEHGMTPKNYRLSKGIMENN